MNPNHRTETENPNGCSQDQPMAMRQLSPEERILELQVQMRFLEERLNSAEDIAERRADAIHTLELEKHRAEQRHERLAELVLQAVLRTDLVGVLGRLPLNNPEVQLRALVQEFHIKASRISQALEELHRLADEKRWVANTAIFKGDANGLPLRDAIDFVLVVLDPHSPVPHDG